ncbi:hypothetical protein [Solicola gregarius]|uniref:Uncharacterized protein n=1 Tax=Solicola gregarius TaxID=2908642 RepID=A0AA46YKT5_9ACTN|nr:hypothetical protein [Solicola gregarius]UYM04934.1 hypothetical protein L0C25_20800 [Solicola gregarius]
MSLFSHHPAKPADIRQYATDSAGQGTAYGVLTGSLSGRASAAAAAVDGYIDRPTRTVTAAPEGSSTELRKASYLATGCLNQYAEAVETYNTGIDDLNRRYDEAKAADFHVDVAMCTVDGTIQDGTPEDRDGAIRSADSSLQATLRGEQETLLAALDSDADAIGKAMDGGPTDDTIMLMIAGGYLPAQAVDAFPGIDIGTLNTIRSYFHEARKLWKTPGKFRKLFSMFAASNDLTEVAAELARTEHQWGAVLGAIGRNLDTTTLASLNTYMQSREEISLLQYTKLFAEGDYNVARMNWINAAKATGKLGGGLAVLSVLANGYDLYDLMANGNQGKSGWDTALRVTGDVTGLVSSGGGLLALTPVLSLGPVGAGILIGAGLVSCGIMIYRNWDDISAAVSTAWNWTGDRISEGWDATTDWASDRWDDAGEALDDAGDAISEGWDAVTPW